MSEAPLTPEQVKAARELLGWTVLKLAMRVGVSEKTIVAFEAGDRWSPHLYPAPHLYPDLVRARLESAGVIFVEENGEGPGVRLRKGTSHT
jgi:DNA-binding XRE family transcriptional regulator